MLVAALVVACAAAVVLVYGWLEAGWLRTRVLEVPLRGLPPALDGVRIGHLSDFHLGARFSLGNRASVKAAAWVAARDPALVCVTGDLVSHPRGEARLRRLLAGLDRPFVVLGNHDVAVTRDPFSRAAELHDLERAQLLRDEAQTVDLRGERVSVVGVDPETFRAGACPSPRPHRPRREPPASALPLPGHHPHAARRVVRPHPGGPPPRRADLPPVAGSSDHAGPPARAPRLRPVRDRRRAHARVAGDRHDLRPVQVLRAPGGDGARPAARALELLSVCDYPEKGGSRQCVRRKKGLSSGSSRPCSTGRATWRSASRAASPRRT